MSGEFIGQREQQRLHAIYQSGMAAERERIRREASEAITKFERDLGFTAPELTGMRIQQLRERIDALIDEPDDGE